MIVDIKYKAVRIETFQKVYHFSQWCIKFENNPPKQYPPDASNVGQVQTFTTFILLTKVLWNLRSSVVAECGKYFGQSTKAYELKIWWTICMYVCSTGSFWNEMKTIRKESLLIFTKIEGKDEIYAHL